MRKFNQRGQGMTEYILIIALIAIFVVGGIKFFGSKTKQGFTDAGKAVGTSVDQGIKGADNQSPDYGK